jgi:allantoicase
MTKIVSTSPTLPKVDPKLVSEALGAVLITRPQHRFPSYDERLPEELRYAEDVMYAAEAAWREAQEQVRRRHAAWEAAEAEFRVLARQLGIALPSYSGPR